MEYTTILKAREKTHEPYFETKHINALLDVELNTLKDLYKLKGEYRMLDNIKSIMNQATHPFLDEEFLKVVSEYKFFLEDLIDCQTLDEDCDYTVSEVDYILHQCPEEFYAVRNLVRKMYGEIKDLRDWKQRAIINELDDKG
tara:strand:+ start:210 stop:635 length:426 start_codon:yes stop_codon:yes gene_type:complete